MAEENFFEGGEEEPLIFTNRGNIPASSLGRREYWQDNIGINVKQDPSNPGKLSLMLEKNGTIAFVEEYYDKETFEVVKRSVAVYTFNGLEIAPALGQFGTG